MKRLYSLFLLFTLISTSLIADEGMWLPSLIKDKIADMQKNGFKLTAEDIYSINQASLKDAIVQFGGGCTGELISDNGLLITNHHCGFGQIQEHSSVEHDYLKDGFWAMSLNEELPNKGLSVKFLVRMEDVTDKILSGYKQGMTENERAEIVKANSASVIAAAKQNNNYEARVEALYYGNQYFLFVYETYTDVRLVGAPPSSIGKFGGDTDNWMWPRHTGDFSIFRIYAGKDNKPAAYSKENIPYKPKKFFSISLNGVKEGDFTLVYGYPGRTQEYLMSDAVKYIAGISNPNKINLRTMRLDIQKEEMSKSAEIRIKYASKNASVANSWKKWQGEAKGIVRLNTVNDKIEFEKAFSVWAKDKPEYSNLINEISAIYKKLEPFAFVNDYQSEAINANEIIKFAGTVYSAALKNSKMSPEISAENISAIMEDFYKDYYMPIDKKSFVAIVGEYYKNVPAKYQPKYFTDKMSEYKTVDSFATYIFDNSIFSSKEKALRFVSDGVTPGKFDNDPAVVMYKEFNDYFTNSVKPVYDGLNNNLNLLYRTYMRGQMEFRKDKTFYPDANSTLRITYGKVKGYVPLDGVYFKHSSTLEGIMQKDNPQIYDYNIPQKLRDLYAGKDFGRWAVNGTVPVCFIATNHTSGGNSGSPVLNGKGELIGLNFDRVWEGTMSDVAYDPDMCRNISLDIRYVLFVIDKLAGAQRLIDEMKLVK
ncbi:MAG: Peptidase [Bacteroidetes bacterium]|nr:Peptidase [Bacteroidota bacterium]